MSSTKGTVLPAALSSAASGKMSLSISLNMQIIMSISGSDSRVCLAAAAESTHTKVGGSDMFKPTYSL